MERINAFLQLVDSIMEASMKEIATSPLTAFVANWKVLAFVGSILAGAFVAGGGTVSWITAQRDYGNRIQKLEEIVPLVLNDGTETKKMVCEIRAILRDMDPLPCWRGEAILNTIEVTR